MPELNNKIELKFLKKMSTDKEAKPTKQEEKPAAKANPKSPVNRVKIAPYAYVEVNMSFYSLSPNI